MGNEKEVTAVTLLTDCGRDASRLQASLKIVTHLKYLSLGVPFFLYSWTVPDRNWARVRMNYACMAG